MLNLYQTKVAYFSNNYYHTRYEDCTVSGLVSFPP